MGVNVDNKCTGAVANALIGLGLRSKDLLKKGKGVEKGVDNHRNSSQLLSKALKHTESRQNEDNDITIKREPVPMQKTEGKSKEKIGCAKKKVISSTVLVPEKTMSEISINPEKKQALPASKIETDNYPSVDQLNVSEPLASQTEQIKKSCIVSTSHSHAVETQNLKKPKKKSMSVSFNPSLEDFEKSTSMHKLCSSHAILNFLTEASSDLVHDHAMRILGAGEPWSRHRGRPPLGATHKKSEEISSVSPAPRKPFLSDKEQVTPSITQPLSPKGDEHEDVDLKTCSLRSIFSRSMSRRKITLDTFSSPLMHNMINTSSRSVDSDVDVCKSSGYFCLLNDDNYFKSDNSPDKRHEKINLDCYPSPPLVKFPDTCTISSGPKATTDEKHWVDGNQEVLAFYKTSDDTLKVETELGTHFNHQCDAVVPESNSSRAPLIHENGTTEIPLKKDLSSHNCEEIHAKYQSNDSEPYVMLKNRISDPEEPQANSVRNNVREPANITANDGSVSYHVREPVNIRENDKSYHVREPVNIRENDRSYHVREPVNIRENDKSYHVRELVNIRENDRSYQVREPAYFTENYVTYPTPSFDAVKTLKGILRSQIPQETISPRSLKSQDKERSVKSRKLGVECPGRSNKEVSFKSHGQDCKKSRLTISNASLVSECQESIRMVESLLLSKESESPGCSGDSFTLDMQELSRKSSLPVQMAQQLKPRDKAKKVSLNAGIDNFSISLHPYPSLSSPKVLYSEAASSSSSSYKLETVSVSPQLNEDASTLTHIDTKSDGSAAKNQSSPSTDTIITLPSPVGERERQLDASMPPSEWYKEHTVKSISREQQSGPKRREHKRHRPERGSPSPFTRIFQESKMPMRNTLILCSAGVTTEFQQLDSMVSQSPGRVCSLKNRKRSKTFPSLQSYLDQIEKENEKTKAPIDNTKRTQKNSVKQKRECSPGANSVSEHLVDKPQEGRERSERQKSFKSKPAVESPRKEDYEITSSVTAKNVHFQSRGTETRDIEGSRMIPHFGIGPHHFVSSSSTSSAGQWKNVGYSKVKEARFKERASPFVRKPVSKKQAKSCLIVKRSQMAAPQKLPKPENNITKTNKSPKVAKFDVRNWKRGVLKNMKRDLDKKVGRRAKPMQSETEGKGEVEREGQAASDRNTDGGVDESTQPNLTSQADVKYVETSEADVIASVLEETQESSAFAFPNTDGASCVISKLRRAMESRLNEQNKCFPVGEPLVESLCKALESENRKNKGKSEAIAKSFSPKQSKANVSTSFDYNDQPAAEVHTNKLSEGKCVQDNERMIPSQAIWETSEQERSIFKDQNQTLHDKNEKNKTPTVSSDFHSRFPAHMPSRNCKLQRTLVRENCIVNVTEISAGSPCDNDSTLVTQNTPSPDLKSVLERAKTVLKQPSPPTKRRAVLARAKGCGQQANITSKADLECLCPSLPTAVQGNEENKYEVHKVKRAGDSVSNINVPATLEAKWERSFTPKKNSYKADIEKEAMPSYTSKYKATESNTLKFSWRGTLAFRKRFQYLMENNKDMATKTCSQRKIQVNGVKGATNIRKPKLDKKVDPVDHVMISPSLQLQLGNKSAMKLPVSQMTSVVSFDRCDKASTRERSYQGSKSPLSHEIVHFKDDKCLSKLSSKQPAVPKAQTNSTHRARVTKKFSESFKMMSSSEHKIIGQDAEADIRGEKNLKPKKLTILARKVASEKHLSKIEQIPSISTMNQINKKKSQRKTALRSILFSGKHKPTVCKKATVSEKSKVPDTETIAIYTKTSPNSLSMQKSPHDTDTKSQSPVHVSREISYPSVISSTAPNIEGIKDIEQMVFTRRTERSHLPINGASQGNEISLEGEETSEACDHAVGDVKETEDLPAPSVEASTKNVWFSTENNSQILPSEKTQENNTTRAVSTNDDFKATFIAEDSSNLSPTTSKSSVNFQFHARATGPNKRISRVRSDLRHLLKVIKTRSSIRDGAKNKNGDKTLAVTDYSSRKIVPNKKESRTGSNYAKTLIVSKEKQEFQKVGSSSLNKATGSRFKSNNDTDNESKTEKRSITKHATTDNVFHASTEKHQDVASIQNVFQQSGTMTPTYVVNKKDELRNAVPSYAEYPDSNLAGAVETATISPTITEAVAAKTATERQTYTDKLVVPAAHAEVIRNCNASPETKRANVNGVDSTKVELSNAAFTTQVLPKQISENEATKSETLRRANFIDKMLTLKENNDADIKELRNEKKINGSALSHVSHLNILDSQNKSATIDSSYKKASDVEMETNSDIHESKNVIPNVAATATEAEQNLQMISQANPRLALIRTEFQSDSKNLKDTVTQAAKAKDVRVTLKKSLRAENVVFQNLAALNTHYQKKLLHENITKASLRSKISENALGLTGVKPLSSSSEENKRVLLSFYRPLTTKAVSKTKSCTDITGKKSQFSLHHRKELVKSKLQTGKIHNTSAVSESKHTELKSTPLSNIRWKFLGIPEDICSSGVKKVKEEPEGQENDKIAETMQVYEKKDGGKVKETPAETMQVYEKKDDGKDNETTGNLTSQIEKVKHSFVHFGSQQTEKNSKMKQAEVNCISQVDRAIGIKRTLINLKSHFEKADKFKRRSVLNQIQEDNKIKQTMPRHVFQTTTDTRPKHSPEKHVRLSEEECSSRQTAMNEAHNKQGITINEGDTTEENKIKNNSEDTTTESHIDTETLKEKDIIQNDRVSPPTRDQTDLENVQSDSRLPELDRKEKSLNNVNEDTSQHSLLTTSNEVSMNVKTRNNPPCQTKRDTEVSCCATPSQVEDKLCTSGYNTADVSSTSVSQFQNLFLHNLIPKKHSTTGSAEDGVHARKIVREKLKNINEEESTDAFRTSRKQILPSYHQAEDVKKTNLLMETINPKTSFSASKKDMIPTFTPARQNKNNRDNCASSSPQHDKIEEGVSGLKATDIGTVPDVTVKGRKEISPNLQNQESRSITHDLVSKVFHEVEEDQVVRNVGLPCDVTEKVPTNYSNAHRATEKGQDDIIAETDHTVRSRGEKSDQCPLPAVVETIKVFSEGNDCNALVKDIKNCTGTDTFNKEFADSPVRIETGKFDTGTRDASDKEKEKGVSQILFEPSENSETDTLTKTLSPGVKTKSVSANETHKKNKYHKVEVTSSESTQDNDENSNRVGYTKSSLSMIGSIKLNTIQTVSRDTIDRPITNKMKSNQVDKKVAATIVRLGNQSEKQIKSKEETLEKAKCLGSCHGSDSKHSLIQQPSQNVFQSKFTKFVGVRRRRYLIENVGQGETNLTTKTPEHTVASIGSHINLVAKQEEAFGSPFVTTVTSPVKSKKSPKSGDDETNRYTEDKNETTLDLDSSHKDVESQKSEPQQNISPPKARKRTLKYRKSGSQTLDNGILSGHSPLKHSWKRDDTFITRVPRRMGNESEVKTVSDVQISLKGKTSEKDSKLPNVSWSDNDSNQTLPTACNKTSRIKKTMNDMLNLTSAHDGAVSYQPISLKRRKLKEGDLESSYTDKSNLEITHSSVHKTGCQGEDPSPKTNGESQKISTSADGNQPVLEGQSSSLKVLDKVTEVEAARGSSCHIVEDALPAHRLTNIASKESFGSPKAGTPSIRSDDLESILNIELKKTSDPKKSILVPEHFFSGVHCNKKRTRRVRQIKQVSSLSSNKEDSQYLRETHGPPESSASISSVKSTQSTASSKRRPSYKQRVPISSKRITNLDDFLQKVEAPILKNVSKSCSKASTSTLSTRAHEADEPKSAEEGQVFKSRVGSEKKECRPQHRSPMTQVSKAESHTTSTVPKLFTEFTKPTVSSSINCTPFWSKNKSQRPDKTHLSETTMKAVEMEDIETGSELGKDNLLQTKSLDSRPRTVETKDEKEQKTSRDLTITGVDEKDTGKEDTDQMREKTNFVGKPDNDVKETLSQKESLCHHDLTKEIMKTFKIPVKSGTSHRDIIGNPEVNKMNNNLNITAGEDLLNAATVPFWARLQDKPSPREEKNASSSSSSIVLSWIGSDALDYDEPFLNTASNFPNEHCNEETPEQKINGSEACIPLSPCSTQVVNNMKKEESFDSDEFSPTRKFTGLSKVWEGAKSRFRNLVTSPKKKRKRIVQPTMNDLQSDTGAVGTTCDATGEFRQTYIGDDISGFFHSDKNYNQAQHVKSIISLPVNISDESSIPHQPQQSNDFYIPNAMYPGYSYSSYAPEDVNDENDEDESWNFQRSISFLSKGKSINTSACLTNSDRLLFEECRDRQSYSSSPFEDTKANTMYRNANGFEDIPHSPVDYSLRNDYVDSAFVYESTKRQSPIITGLRFRQEDYEPTPQEKDKRSPYFSFENGHSQHRASVQWSDTQRAHGLEHSDWPQPSETLNGYETNLLFENPRKSSTPKPRPRLSTCEGRKNRKIGQYVNQTTEYEKERFSEKRVRFDSRSGTPSIPSPNCRSKSHDARTQKPITRKSLEQHLIAMAGIQDNRNDPPSVVQRGHEGAHSQKPQSNKDPKMVPGPGIKKPRKNVSLEQHLSTRSDGDGPQVNDSSTEQQGSNNDASKSTSSQASINWYKPQSLPSPASVTVVHESIPQPEPSRATLNQGSSQMLPSSQWRRTRMPLRQRLDHQAITDPLLTPTATAGIPPSTNVPDLMLSSFRFPRDQNPREPRNTLQVRPRQSRETSRSRSPESCAKTVSKIVEMFEKIRDA